MFANFLSQKCILIFRSNYIDLTKYAVVDGAKQPMSAFRSEADPSGPKPEVCLGPNAEVGVAQSTCAFLSYRFDIKDLHSAAHATPIGR